LDTIQSEICLLGTKGSPKRIDRNIPQVIMSVRKKHSQKPVETYERIEKLLGDVPKIELFARSRRKGWDTWGNEVKSNIHLSLKVVSGDNI